MVGRCAQNYDHAEPQPATGRRKHLFDGFIASLNTADGFAVPAEKRVERALASEAAILAANIDGDLAAPRLDA
jgi:hypothetical protein